MERSKLIFGIIVALVITVILLIVFVLPDSGLLLMDPSESADTGLGTLPTEPKVPYVPPTSMTLPSGTPTMPLPTDSTTDGLISSYVPEEAEPEDLPQSSGYHYMNQGPIGTTVYFEGHTYLIQLGTRFFGPQKYLYLNPSVVVVGEPNFHITDYQFVFLPSEGYVATITSAQKGDYTSSHGCTTFERAFDYGLPSGYVSAECPGTVWYRDEVVIPTAEDPAIVQMQVLVYAKGNFLASLQYAFAADASGTYYMGFMGDLNQIAMGDYYNSYCHRMDKKQLSDLLERVKSDAAAPRAYGFNTDAEKLSGLTLDDLIIEWREPGAGTYFDYTCSLGDDGAFIASDDLKGTALVAVSIRRGPSSVYKGPTTLYYRVTDSEAGAETFELVAIEGYPMFHRYLLYVNGYPGYSEPLWD